MFALALSIAINIMLIISIAFMAKKMGRLNKEMDETTALNMKLNVDMKDAIRQINLMKNVLSQFTQQ